MARLVVSIDREAPGSNPGALRPTPNSVPRAVVLIVAPPPQAALVATAWRASEPLVHTPEVVNPALVRRVGVVHHAVLERKRAHARPFAPVRRPVRPNARRDRGDERIFLAAARQP